MLLWFLYIHMYPYISLCIFVYPYVSVYIYVYLYISLYVLLYLWFILLYKFLLVLMASKKIYTTIFVLKEDQRERERESEDNADGERIVEETTSVRPLSPSARKLLSEIFFFWRRFSSSFYKLLSFENFPWNVTVCVVRGLRDFGGMQSILFILSTFV